jgi:hypothetical protein
VCAARNRSLGATGLPEQTSMGKMNMNQKLIIAVSSLSRVKTCAA